MNILVTNDDGITSPGLWALAEAMCGLGDVLVVAPDKQQSGVGSCVSLHNDMDIHETKIPVDDVRAFTVAGTPSDCVMLGLRRLTESHIDLLVSGINLGPNVGRDIPYSGTVMATLQGYYRKIPSIAVSLFNQNRETTHDYTVTGKFVKNLGKNLLCGCLNTSVIFNVNVPNLPRGNIKGVYVTRTAATGYVNLSAHRHGSNVKYSLELDRSVNDILEEGTDIWAIHHDYISVTPLQFNITDQTAMLEIREALLDIEDW